MLNRRAFLQLVTAGANAITAFLLGIPGLRFILDRRRRDGASTFVPAALLDHLTTEAPLRVTLLGERRDAFIAYPSSPLGSVFLIRDAAPTGESVRCLHTVCPHLGCAVQYSAERRLFECPCHASAFDLTGKVLSGPSPRAMDELQCRVAPPDASGKQWIEVHYRSFRTGTPNRTPLS